MDGIRVKWEADDRKERESRRYAVSVPVRLRPEGMRLVEVCVGDISATGLMARTEQPIPLGAHATIELPGIGPVQARIRWTVGERIGARFAEPIDVAYCRAEMMKLAETC